MSELDGLVRFTGGLTIEITPAPPDYEDDRFVAMSAGFMGFGNTPSAALTDLLETLEDDVTE